MVANGEIEPGAVVRVDVGGESLKLATNGHE
jgi:hypothetical protein